MAKNVVRGVTNGRLLARLADMSNGGQGVVLLASGNDWISDVIREAEQSAFRARKRSLWSHAAFVAEPYRGPDTIVLESTVPKVDSVAKLLKAVDAIVRGKFGGVHERRLSAFTSAKGRPNLALMDFAPTATEVRKLVAEGRKILAKPTYYPAAGLVGTWAFYLVWQLGKRAGLHLGSNISNPLSEPSAHHLYCSAFVQKAYLKAGTKWDFTHDFAASATSPEHIWRTSVPQPDAVRSERPVAHLSDPRAAADQGEGQGGQHDRADPHLQHRDDAGARGRDKGQKDREGDPRCAARVRHPLPSGSLR